MAQRRKAMAVAPKKRPATTSGRSRAGSGITMKVCFVPWYGQHSLECLEAIMSQDIFHFHQL
jgi:hypothetical protein